MARHKKQAVAGKNPVWLITYSDLMTLLMTFFVLLVSMSVIDERAKKTALGSVSRHFAFGRALTNLTSKTDAAGSFDAPGRMEDVPAEDLDPLRDMVFDEQEKDLDFQENRYVQIFSINADVLFEQGGFELTRRGRELLDKVVPYLQRVEYPLLVAGHTSARRDEEGDKYSPDFDPTHLDPTWLLSFRRSHAVYRHFTERGVLEKRLTLEAFGQFHPRFSNDTPDGRKKTRRVDLVLDKRNLAWIRRVEELRAREPEVPREYHYQGFEFNLDMPGANRPEQ